MNYGTENIKERKIRLLIPKDSERNLSKKDPVFYNPAAKINRELTIAFLKSVKINSALDLLSASGAMGLNLAKEIPNCKVYLNDKNPEAVKLIKKNIKKNKIKNAEVSNKSANKLLEEIKKVDYIDIDPFGPPVPFLDNAVTKTKKYLAITSTDTSALSGTYPKACLRKYNSMPLKNEFMHETGLRILIKRAQEIGLKHDVGLIPLFSFHFERYSRTILKVEKDLKKIRENLGYICYCNNCLWSGSSKRRRKVCPKCKGQLKIAGKLWIGNLWDKKIINKMLNQELSPVSKKIVERIKNEEKLNSIGFYDVHKICKKLKREVPKTKTILQNLKNNKIKACRTHLSDKGIKTNKKIKIEDLFF